MAARLLNARLLSANPAAFTSRLSFEITLECTAPLRDGTPSRRAPLYLYLRFAVILNGVFPPLDIELSAVYVGSAANSSFDQVPHANHISCLESLHCQFLT